MKLVIGISTMNDGIHALYERVSKIKECFTIVICHQVTNDTDYDYKNYADPNVKVYPKREKGLSKSRNILLQGAREVRADYIIISDDDVEYDFDNLVVFKEFVESNQDSPAHYQFKSSDLSGKDRKKYSSKKYELGILDIFKVSSIEICLNISLLDSQNICFDEQFGLGARYPVGEEAVLLADIKKNKQKIIFIPIAITIHPIESTGILLFTQPLMVMSRGAMFKRCFGTLTGFVMLLLFWFKKFMFNKGKRGHISGPQALSLLIKGFKDSE